MAPTGFRLMIIFFLVLGAANTSVAGPSPSVADATPGPGPSFPIVNGNPSMLLAQDSQVSAADAAKAQKDMNQVKANLERRAKELTEEFEAIQKEADAIGRIGGGQTLQGSRAREYSKRVKALNERKIQYQKDRDQLDQDMRLYEEALQKMEQGVASGVAPAPSAAPSPEMERLKSEIEDRRKRLVEEYRSLQKEKTAISAGGGSQSGGPSVSEQMAEWNAKMKEHAKSRRSFNEAVKSFNTTTGQKLPTLPPL